MPGHDIGVAILVLTVLIKIVLHPFSISSLKSQKALQALQPKMEELKRKYKHKREELTRATMELYKKEKVSPFSSCLPLLIQFPFLIAVYQVFRSGLKSDNLNLLYSFVDNPGSINPVTMGLMDLSKPSIVLAILAGIAQYFSTKMLVKKKQPPINTKKPVPGAKDENMMSMMNKNMSFMMPIFTVIIGISLPGGLTLYWFITTLLMLVQQWYFLREKPKSSVTQVVDKQSVEKQVVVDKTDENIKT